MCNGKQVVKFHVGSVRKCHYPLQDVKRLSQASCGLSQALLCKDSLFGYQTPGISLYLVCFA